MARMTKTEARARDMLMRDLIHLSREDWVPATLAETVPEAWHTLEADLDVEEAKQKVTLYLDRSVVRFYRAMGRGYQARINRLLATWAQMKIAGEVQLDEHLKKRLGYRESGPDDEQAETARDEHRPVTRIQELQNAGETRSFDVTECPLAGDDGDEADGTEKETGGLIGYAFPHGSGENPAPPAAAEPTKLPPHAAMGEAVLKGLGTGIAIFDHAAKLVFANEAYRDMWRLEADWLAEGRDFPEILEHLRAERRLPEVPDFRAYKMEQLAMFDDAEGAAQNDPFGDLMHLPDGRTLRAVAYPMPTGGLALGYDDVTDQLDLESSNNAQDAIYRASLEHLAEAIAVFGSDGRLKFWNPAFARLWDLAEDVLGPQTHVGDFVEATRPLAATGGDWDAKKAHIISAMTRREVTRDTIERADGRTLEFVNAPLPDGGVLIAYTEAKTENGADALGAADPLPESGPDKADGAA